MHRSQIIHVQAYNQLQYYLYNFLIWADLLFYQGISFGPVCTLELPLLELHGRLPAKVTHSSTDTEVVAETFDSALLVSNLLKPHFQTCPYLMINSAKSKT